MQNPKPQRSNFDLISGMILGGLLVGVMMPVANKFLNSNEAKGRFSMKAKAPISQELKKRDKERKAIASANIEVAPISFKPSLPLPEAKVEPKTEELPKAEVPKIKTSKQEPEKKKNEAKRLEKTATLAAKKKNKATTSEAEAPRATMALAAKKLPESQELVELSSPQSAELIAQKSDQSLTDNRIESIAPGERFIVINNAQYSKEQLENCPKRCLLKSTDAKGQTVYAVISGPAFAEALKEHQGTINLTGIKRTVKGSEIFLVQSITYNLPGSARTADAKKSPDNAPKAAPKNRQDSSWEDLKDEVKIR